MYLIFERLFLGGVAVAAIGILWLLVKLIRSPSKFGGPILVVLLGIGLTLIPVGYTRFFSQVDLGEHENIVDGKRHLTLTGWDRKGYDFLVFKTDTVVLQMANEDVTDETLGYLQRMDRLEELDLDNTKISDAGLAAIGELKSLRVLRLAGTKISDDGFKKHLSPLENLKQLNLRNTEISAELIDEWRANGQGRRAMR